MRMAQRRRCAGNDRRTSLPRTTSTAPNVVILVLKTPTDAAIRGRAPEKRARRSVRVDWDTGDRRRTPKRGREPPAYASVPVSATRRRSPRNVLRITHGGDSIHTGGMPAAPDGAGSGPGDGDPRARGGGHHEPDSAGDGRPVGCITPACTPSPAPVRDTGTGCQRAVRARGPCSQSKAERPSAGLPGWNGGRDIPARRRPPPGTMDE